jgi:hypothetical protein
MDTHEKEDLKELILELLGDDDIRQALFDAIKNPFSVEDIPAIAVDYSALIDESERE